MPSIFSTADWVLIYRLSHHWMSFLSTPQLMQGRVIEELRKDLNTLQSTVPENDTRTT